tara:strand:- start:58 stop:768 length:711 start_codon:yes stop_codon:yes gene_type:complete
LKATFVIPCFNEEKNIPILFKEIQNIVNKNGDINFILVNNGSFDQSEKVLTELINEYGNFERISFESVTKNIGYGNGVLQGLKLINTELVGWVHADLQNNLNNIEVALDLYKKAKLEFPNFPIYIRGKRVNRDNPMDKIYTNLMAMYTSLTKQGFYSDITGLPVLMETKQYKSWDNPPLGFALDVYSYIFAQRNNSKIIRFPVRLNLRKHGSSSWNNGIASKIKMSIYYIKEIRNI